METSEQGQASTITPALAAWLHTNVPGFRGPAAMVKFAGGQSNPTYRITSPTHQLVLRRKPSGQLLKGAHAIEREARVVRALAGSDVPVPHVHGLCEDSSIIGAAFYVMDMVEGRIFWEATFPGIAREDRPAYFAEMNRVIAALHSVDVNNAGLADFGRKENYLERQIQLWTRQYLSDEDAGRDPHMDRLISWLPTHIPGDGGYTVVHGDFRCDNLIFHPDKPEVLAVLDWELSTLGDPLADFCYHTMMYRMPPHIVAGLRGSDLSSLNIPTEDDYVAEYCARTGRDSFPDYAFYMAFNFFRVAAIVHGIKGRFLRGNASSASATEKAAHFPELAAIAWGQAQLAGAA